jgi:hypothetical protein
MVWKDPYYAITYEDSGNRIDAEAYIAARNGVFYFNSVFQFHEEVLKAFITDQQLLTKCMLDKKEIPQELRPAIIAAESEYIISHWEAEDGEPNDYYRMLYGLPPVGTEESAFFYNTKYDDIDKETPLHRLSSVDLLKLENRGYLDELLGDNPDDSIKYLGHMASKKVYPYVSRQAEYYQLLHVPSSSYDYLRDDFIDTYEEARCMVLRVYYTDAYRNQSHLYEGFLGLLILFITQQRMCSKYLEADISRNFYDLNSLRLVYDAYEVPFYSDIPLKYHTSIVKHINELIAYKGSTQVFYDTFGLFDFGSMEVFEYYMVKERKTDSDGNPIFRDSEGNLLSEQDQFNIRFAKVAWPNNKFVEVTDPDNKVEYEELTTQDPYWVEDEDLKAKLYGSDWNYYQSKYMGVQIMFDLTKLLYECCFFLHELQDNRGTLKDITTYYMVTGEDISIYDMVIYAMALLCKNAGYVGEIPSDPASVAAVYGFNFQHYNELLKMATIPMGDFVTELKTSCHNYANANPILSIDKTLDYLIEQITDGAFNWLGSDFPYNQWGMAPSPVFLRDFTPTSNSVETLRKYLSETINTLKTDESLTEYEILQLYAQFITTDDFIINVQSSDSIGSSLKYQTFVVKSRDFDDVDRKTLRKAVIASYEHMLSWLIKILDMRSALTFDPHILELISNMNINSADDVCRVYDTIEELDEYLTYRIRVATTREEYEAFANVRKILMTTHLVKDTLTTSDGKVANTYADLLADVNPTLYERFIAEDFDAETEEQYVLQTLMKLCDDLTLLESVNTDNIQRVVNYMFKILRFLKSAKVDLVDFHIIYMITDRTMNFIKFISEVHTQQVTRYPYKPNQYDLLQLYPLLHRCIVIQYWEDYLTLLNKNMDVKVYQYWHDQFVELCDDIKAHLEYMPKDYFEFIFDWLHSVSITWKKREPLMLLLKKEGHIQSDLNVEAGDPNTFYLLTQVAVAEQSRLIKEKYLELVDSCVLEMDDSIMDKMDTLSDEVNLADVKESPVNDGVMWTDSLIKVEESISN